MSANDFDHFFEKATGNKPYDYQRRLAGATADRRCESQLISIPTGLGKTAAIVLAWLWNRAAHPSPEHRATWPRRLVICLPMRTLVEQTEAAVHTWLGKLALPQIDVHVLMGGEDRSALRDWDTHPERLAILIGTQDLLISRALNRGYGLSRYRWPMHFGLLNNDTLWVYDELQLMGVSVETSAQLAGFRQKHGVARDCHSWWMSATLDSSRLLTVDYASAARALPTAELSDEEKQTAPVRQRRESVKKLHPAPVAIALTKASEKSYSRAFADYILQHHEADSFTLVIVNRVVRAQEIFAYLEKSLARSASPPALALVHSRFRAGDRAGHTKCLTDTAIKHKIVIATQAVEAGVDVSAKTLITELAPWSSLVQRFGRCNRGGEFVDPHSPATIHWIDVHAAEKEDLALPYETTELAVARTALLALTVAGPAALSAVSISPQAVIRPVIRRKDFIDLFDTTPDIAGHDLDVSRYIREGDDTDAQVAWRALADDKPPAESDPKPTRDELCRVPVHALNDFLKKQPAYAWDPLARKWLPVKRVHPGMICILPASLGGYDDRLGWTGDKKSKVTPLPLTAKSSTPSAADENQFGDNGLAQTGRWQSIAEHTRDVEAQLDEITAAITLPPESLRTLQTAARFHDIGKAHGAFQSKLNSDARTSAEANAHGPVAKAPSSAWKPASAKLSEEDRPLFRHELASALAVLAHPELIAADNPDLVAYLIAAHHGKVRLSIRSLPGEKIPPPIAGANDRRFARGIWEDDDLPAVCLSDGTLFPATQLSLVCMELGSAENTQGPSWLARMIILRDSKDLGPFRLAWLEALLRAADMRASMLD